MFTKVCHTGGGVVSHFQCVPSNPSLRDSLQFLAAQSSSRSLVVSLSVRWSVLRLTSEKLFFTRVNEYKSNIWYFTLIAVMAVIVVLVVAVVTVVTVVTVVKVVTVVAEVTLIIKKLFTPNTLFPKNLFVHNTNSPKKNDQQTSFTKTNHFTK